MAKENVISKNIKKLLILDKINIQYDEYNNCYDLSVKKYKNNNNNIICSVFDDGSVKYFINGCYNSGFDYIEINIDELNQLQEALKELNVE